MSEVILNIFFKSVVISRMMATVGMGMGGGGSNATLMLEGDKDLQDNL